MVIGGDGDDERVMCSDGGWWEVMDIDAWVWPVMEHSEGDVELLKMIKSNAGERWWYKRVRSGDQIPQTFILLI